MRLRLLGTAAGGGAPQWNCACPQCVRLRIGGDGRTQDCVTVSGDGRTWHLLNASPDIRVQLLAAPELAPRPPRVTPLTSVVLTDAELDHTLGLLSLREAGELRIFATPAVLATFDTAFPVRALLGAYAPVVWQELGEQPIELAGGLTVAAVPLGWKRPKYEQAAHADPASVVALRLTDAATGAVVVYAPCVAQWCAELDAALAGAACLILDGTFFAFDEMARRAGAVAGRQAAMGHLPMQESLPHLARHPGLRVIYTHLNNTNPALSGDSAQAAQVRAAGAEIGADGQLLTFPGGPRQTGGAGDSTPTSTEDAP
ncbi:MAG: pyrroloquinoline quinone biosynthesis protein PqqB [Hamadaea sp.]|nr:pyrroloquinoline quinone biosynthesis protein PqqB [Hamadaea sp.]